MHPRRDLAQPAPRRRHPDRHSPLRPRMRRYPTHPPDQHPRPTRPPQRRPVLHLPKHRPMSRGLAHPLAGGLRHLNTHHPRIQHPRAHASAPNPDYQEPSTPRRAAEQPHPHPARTASADQGEQSKQVHGSRLNACGPPGREHLSGAGRSGRPLDLPPAVHEPQRFARLPGYRVERRAHREYHSATQRPAHAG
jgi:hypothetical protein